MGNPPSDHQAPEPLDPGAEGRAPGAPVEPGSFGAPEPADPHDPTAREITDDAAPGELLDLARISADLDGVEAALRRLDDGTYFTAEVTGREIADEVLAADPIARRSDTR